MCPNMPYWMLIELPFLGYQGCQKQTEHHFNLQSNEISIESRWTSSQNISLCSNYKRHLVPSPPAPHMHSRDGNPQHMSERIIIAIRNNSAWICNTDILNGRRQTNQGKRPALCFCWPETVLRELCLPIPPPEPCLVRAHCPNVSLSSLA